MENIHLTGTEESAESTVGSFVGNLPELVGSMMVDPRTLVAIASFDDERYVQFWLESPRYLVAEVISNLNIGDAVALSQHDEEQLRAMGWAEPSPGPNPNWRIEGDSVRDLISMVKLTERAIYEVLGEQPNNRVRLRTFPVERAGKTTDEARNSFRVYQDSEVALTEDLRAATGVPEWFSDFDAE
jgi:hypothetical protein